MNLEKLTEQASEWLEDEDNRKKAKKVAKKVLNVLLNLLDEEEEEETKEETKEETNYKKYCQECIEKSKPIMSRQEYSLTMGFGE